MEEPVCLLGLVVALADMPVIRYCEAA